MGKGKRAEQTGEGSKGDLVADSLWVLEEGLVVAECEVAEQVFFAARNVAEEVVDAVGYRFGGDEALGLGEG